MIPIALLKLHLGCGPRSLPGWVNVDIVEGPGVDQVDDARVLRGFSSSSVDLIYASHLLDHFSRVEVQDVLRVWHSRLKPGGTLRLAVSDFAAISAEYQNGSPLRSLLGLLVGGHKDAFDRHGVLFDLASLTLELERAGFVDVRRWDWRTTEHSEFDDFSQAYLPHMDKEHGRLMSLNLEADRPTESHSVKPGTDVVREFYHGQVKAHGLNPSSSVPDLFIREREVEAILNVMESKAIRDRSHILEVGCGNGYLLQQLHERGYQRVSAMDFLPEFVELARSRGTGFDIQVGDVRDLAWRAESFDVVVSERVVINLLDLNDQAQAFRELIRVLRPGGYLILIEAFAQAWRNLNAARSEFGLPPHPMAAHNRWLEENELHAYTTELVPCIGDDVPPRNFLSSYFYTARVLHDLVLQRPGSLEGQVVKDSIFARFLGKALPPIGDYANIQFLCYHKSS